MRAAVLAVLLAGCGYASQYAAPPDGRPRAVWREDRVVVEPAGAPLGVACQEEVAALLARGSQPSAAPMGPTGPVFVPQFWGAPLVVVTPGLAPLPARPPRFVPPPPSAAAAAASTSRRIGSSVGGVGGSSLGDLGKGGGTLVAVLAVVAIVLLPVIDVALSLAPAESAVPSASAIDTVNSTNDLLRWPGSPCHPSAP